MVRILLALILIPTLLLGGCVRDTLNIGSSLVLADDFLHITSVDITAENFNAGESATVEVEWTSGTPPISISIDVGTEDGLPLTEIATRTYETDYSWEFTLEEGEHFNWTVTVYSAHGYDQTSGSYGPVGPALN